MKIFSFHLLETTPAITLGAFFRPPTKNTISGLRHAECMSVMTLGSRILSTERMQLRKLAMFAFWENEEAIDNFMADTRLGHKLSEGWHVRLQFLRQWGQFSEFTNVPDPVADTYPEQPIVALTLARLKLPEIFRFIHWGKPVEELVRDNPNTTLAMAGIRPLRTFSTFSVWRSQRDMTDMVHGRNSYPGASRHTNAMTERERRDFHNKFTTFRFRAVSEHGTWQGRDNIIPQGKANLVAVSPPSR